MTNSFRTKLKLLGNNWPFPNPPHTLTNYQAILLHEALYPSLDVETPKPPANKRPKRWTAADLKAHNDNLIKATPNGNQ